MVKSDILGPCFCMSSRTGTLVAGLFDVIIGLAGLSLVLLDPLGRHFILDPVVVTERQLEDLHYDTIKDTFQFLIEFWLPALSLFLLGLLLILAAVVKNSCLVLSSFVFSSITLGGFFMGLLCLLMSGANLLGVTPFIIVTLFQCCFYVVIVDFSRYEWERKHAEDKEMLVISKA